MKRTLLSIVALFTFACVASAGTFKAFTLLTVPYLEVTNTFGVTNLTLIGGITTNVPGVIFTNNGGTKVITVASTNSATNYASFNFFQDVPLWGDPTSQIVSSNGTGDQSFVGLSGVSVVVLLKGGTGANTATSFVLVPILDGDIIGGDPGRESNQAGDAFTFAVTPNTTTFVSLRTNWPSWNYRATRGIRVKSITAGDTDANSQVGIYKLEVVGYVP